MFKKKSGDNFMNEKGGLIRETLKCKFTPEELIEYLNNIISDEIRKSVEEMNHVLISECTDWLLEIKNQSVNLTQEELHMRAKSIVNKYYHPKSHLKTKYLKVIIAACMVIIVSISANLIALSMGYNIAEEISRFGKSILNIPEKQQMNEDEISLIKTTDVKTYSDIQSAIESQQIDIVYPKLMPMGYVVNTVEYIDLGDYIELFVRYESSGAEIIFTVDNNSNIHNYDNFKNNEDIEEYHFNQIIHFILRSDTSIQVMWNIDEYFYTITCNNYDIAVEMLSNTYN